VARSGHHSVRRRGRKICSRGRGAQGGLHLPEYSVDAPRGAGSRRRCQWRRRVQRASTRGTPEGQGAGGPRGSAGHLVLPRRANVKGAAGARRPSGRDLYLDQLGPAAATEVEGSISLEAWGKRWHWGKEVKCRRSRGDSI
jgi:hypothetical protein